MGLATKRLATIVELLLAIAAAGDIFKSCPNCFTMSSKVSNFLDSLERKVRAEASSFPPWWDFHMEVHLRRNPLQKIPQKFWVVLQQPVEASQECFGQHMECEPDANHTTL